MGKTLPAKRTKTTEEWEPFQIDGCDVRLYRRSGPPNPLVPKFRPYLFNPDILRELAWAIWPHDDGDPSPMLLVGPKGCGKTSVILQLANRCNQGVYRTNFNLGTTVKHLMGTRGAKDGSTVVYDGIATRSMEEGLWLLCDEISGATPHVALSLMPILEPDGEVYLPEAEPPRYVQRNKHFRLIGSDNVIGAKQEEHRFHYSGTNPDQNEALLDRFHSTIQCGYAPKEEEHQIVDLNVPLAKENSDYVQVVIRIANKIRVDPDAPQFSTRMVIEWVRRIVSGRVDSDGKVYPLSLEQIHEAAAYAFLNKMRSMGDRTAVDEVIRRVLNEMGGSS